MNRKKAAHAPETLTCVSKDHGRLFALLHSSEDEFTSEYKRSYAGTPRAKEFFFFILFKLKEVLIAGNTDVFERLYKQMNYVGSLDDATLVYSTDPDNPLKSTNLSLLACKYNRSDILKFLLCNDTRVESSSELELLDEENHNAFYYAMRSSDVNLFDLLINDKYFISNPEKLEHILASTYEELKLKNVLLTDEIEVIIENKLINLSFFSQNSLRGKNVPNDINKIKERIRLVLEKIDFLRTEFSGTKDVDETFLYVARFIAQNIYVLKRLLKSTYGRLPWEEMEFCLVGFISSYVKRQEFNLLLNSTLNKDKVLKHLGNFSKKLENEKDLKWSSDVYQLAEIPKLTREQIVAEIIKNSPEFEQLYNDYQELRDYHSLEKISDYLNLAMSANPKEREGQIIITRVLQIIGEYLKNTLESPKLSSSTSDLLLSSLPPNTRKILVHLRNSLSHSYSLSKRTEIEEKSDSDFFTGVQNDAKKINNLVFSILLKSKIETIMALLKRITNITSMFGLKEIVKSLDNVDFDRFTSENFKIMEQEKLENLVQKLSDSIIKKTKNEEMLFKDIDQVFSSVADRSKDMQFNYDVGFVLLKNLCLVFRDDQLDSNGIRGVKFRANQILKNITPTSVKPRDIKEIAQIATKIFQSAAPRAEGESQSKLRGLISKIFFIAERETGDVKWIQKLQEKLREKGTWNPTFVRKTHGTTRKHYGDKLTSKLLELRTILSNNGMNVETTKNLVRYKSNKTLQSVIEMLVLDILSLLSKDNYLENNLFFLDSSVPILTGKCLRDHLAHDNVLLNVLLHEPSMAVVINAIKFSNTGASTMSKQKIGKVVKDSPSTLKTKFSHELFTVTNQERMFTALTEGNAECLNNCLEKGADIHSRTIHLWTALHFASMGSNLEMLKSLLKKNLKSNVTDIFGRNPLHIAAMHGRPNIVEYLIKEAGMRLDDVDNLERTPLHIAARNGHSDTVLVLLKLKACTFTYDSTGSSPVHLAVKHGHNDVVQILMREEVTVDMNRSMGGYTSLHIAAEFGHLEVVNFLLKSKSDVNATNDNGWTPLHPAALNGHLEVIRALIQAGADASHQVNDGCTSLHYAVENGHEKIAGILLERKAKVDLVDHTFGNSPLHYAAQDGREGIVIILLENKANANLSNFQGLTPLHFAAGGGHLKIVSILLKHGVKVNSKDIKGGTPLHHAIEMGHKDIVRILIEGRATVDATDFNEITPLHLATAGVHIEIMDLLINNKARVNTVDLKDYGPLHYAASTGNIAAIDLLLQNKAEIQAKTNAGCTPLHKAAFYGFKDAVGFLLQNNAQVDCVDSLGFTPLHVAAARGHTDIVEFLLKNKVEVNAKGLEGTVPLHLAVEAGHADVAELLLASGANVNANMSNFTPLSLAVRNNRRKMVEILLANGANEDKGSSFISAIFFGYSDIVEIFLKNGAVVNMKHVEDATPLHVAAKQGEKKIVNALISKGANLNALTVDNVTPLHCAASEGHEEVVEILIANKADVNVVSSECGTALHGAATCGSCNVIEILLKNGASNNIKDRKNRTPLEVAVFSQHLKAVEKILLLEKVNLNAQGNGGWTLLHVASQEDNVEMVKYLVDRGCDINATNDPGSKPIHIAAREGFKDIVEFFLSQGLSVNEVGAAKQSLLHYAAFKNRFEMADFLIARGADVNLRDCNGSSPLHMAAKYGSQKVAEALLLNGAFYNSVDWHLNKPREICNGKGMMCLLESIEKLFEGAKRNDPSEVENAIKSGVVINAKNTDNGSPLHYAAWKGSTEVVNILLKSGANPNIVGNKGFTALHYATKFSHYQIVTVLLSYGAIFNAVSGNGKTPLDFAVDGSITSLLTLLCRCFENVKKGNPSVISELNQVKDKSLAKPIMCARDVENHILVEAAILCNFEQVEQLKSMFQDGVQSKTIFASLLAQSGEYKKASNLLKETYEERKNVMGEDNPGTLEVQSNMAKTLYKEGKYQKSLSIIESICSKQIKSLGPNNKATLKSKSFKALILHRLIRDDEAFGIFQEIYPKQEKLLGADHSDTLETLFHMALVMHRLKKFEEALSANKLVFKKRKKSFGENDPLTISAQNNIAMVLLSQGKTEEALKLYREVYKKKQVVLGVYHAATLRTLYNIGGVFFTEEKYIDALKTYREALGSQERVLGSKHPHVLDTQLNIANVLLAQGNCTSALKAFTELLGRLKATFGPNHPLVLDVSKRISAINLMSQWTGSNPSEAIKHLKKDINLAANDGNFKTVQSLLNDGADVNDKDIDGRTPLHFSINNGHTNVVNLLLKCGANPAQSTNKGNTPLHTAVTKGYKEIVNILLDNTNPNKLLNFLNAGTVASGTTALHIAAKSGFPEIVNSLLQHGATYNVVNKEGKTPLEVTNHHKIAELLKLTDRLFKDTTVGDAEVLPKLKALKIDDFTSVTNARNNQENTLLQVAIANKRKNIATHLLELLKKPDKNIKP